jgi:uncharacterized membrane protein
VSTNRLEAFSDGVMAIIITIMVLELKVPEGDGWDTLRPVVPSFFIYVLSFAYIGIYWNNHHHMFQATDEVDGAILWANLHLLFWLSLVPVATAWVGEEHAAALPTALYGVVLLLAAIAYFILERTIIAQQGPASRLRLAVGRDLKGKTSPLFYLAGIALASVNHWIAIAFFVVVAAMWIVPDSRIESLVRG